MPRSNDFLAGRRDHREIVWTSMSDVDPKRALWLWRPYLPLGKVTLVAGAPGHGKSQLTALFAAMTTRADFFPSDLNTPGRVIIVSAEDDLADTIVPRLMAANADMSLVETVNVRTTYPNGLTADGLIKLPGDIEALYARLQRGDVRLVVFDPVVSFFSRDHSSLANQDVRDVLDPLKAMAEKFTTSMVAILHLNKQSEVREWSARIAESHGFQAVARSILALGPDPDDDEGEAGVKKVLALPKSNLARRAGASWRVEIRAATVFSKADVPIETSRIELTGLCGVAAEDLLLNDEQRSAHSSAREFVEDYLADGWRKVGDLKAEAIKAGHGWRTIERVRRDLCQTQKEPGVQFGPWWVALSTTPPLVPGMAGLDGVAEFQERNTAKTDRTPLIEPSALTTNAAKAVNDLELWRRERDRRLGERWDDE